MPERHHTVRQSLAAGCVALLLALAATAGLAQAPSASEEISDLSLEDILELKVSVTSLVEQPADQAPGIVSVITRQEIEDSGARTLDDLLVFIPGITPAQDEQNARGYGIRGLWSMEGKMLVLLDGVRINEPLYGNTVFARQFSVDLIERIEIIRGPASSIYGEYGELAVMNIVSISPHAQGGAVTVTYGQGRDSWNRRIASGGWAGALHGIDVSLTGSLGAGHLGNGDFTNQYGETFGLEHFDRNDFWMLNAGAGYRGLSVRFIGSSLQQDFYLARGYGEEGDFYPVPDRPIQTSFDNYSVDARYAWKPADGLTITPRLSYQHGNTWRKDGEWVFDEFEDPRWGRHRYRDFPDTRVNTGATAAWELTARMTLVLGSEWNHESIEAHLPAIAAGDPWEYYYFFGDDTTKVSTNLHSFFGEYDLRTRIVDVTVGGRIDKHDRFKTAWLPRVALTRRFGRFYAKGLASRAYHPPTLMTNMWQDPSIKPEYAGDYEAEIGYKPSEESLIRLNAFAIEIKPAIFYSGTFSNARAHSRGLEAEGCYETRRVRLDATWSLYRAHYDDRENAMAEDEDGHLVPEVTLGFPTHKATLSASLKAGHGISVSPGLVWYSRRYTRSAIYSWDEENGEDYTAENRALPAALFANVYTRAVFLNGWEFGLGVFNLTDVEYPSLTSAYTGNPSIPGPSREYVARVGYSF